MNITVEEYREILKQYLSEVAHKAGRDEGIPEEETEEFLRKLFDGPTSGDAFEAWLQINQPTKEQ